MPAKKPRINAGIPSRTSRDLSMLDWIADQRAVQYDQIRRLLGRASEDELDVPGLLSQSRTTQIVKR
jgi:hypothetical protein